APPTPRRCSLVRHLQPDPVAVVRASATFINGHLVQPPAEPAAAQQLPHPPVLTIPPAGPARSLIWDHKTGSCHQSACWPSSAAVSRRPSPSSESSPATTPPCSSSASPTAASTPDISAADYVNGYSPGYSASRCGAMALALGRAAPAIIASRHGDPEPAVFAGGRAQLDQEPGPGDGQRRDGRAVRHDHAAADA